MNHTNLLSKESSPYLLQHAHNPVNWYAWNDDTLALAKKENKLILVSIGYSACHWCHVMEHESFEDEHVAAIMNQHFINIKVDREERPDIDMVYMGAVQLMTGQGGWPLNCFALPDGRPIYGGTYFPKQQWVNVLENLADLFKTNPDKAYEYAAHLTDGLEQLEIPKAHDGQSFEMTTLHKSVYKWKQSFDTEWGGPNRAPKFPLPNNYLFLLNYQVYESDLQIKKQLDLTLTKMAWGGIYDQIGGGFARYSTDTFWKVPHFEKMLYDNAQLVSLYTQAYKQSGNELYKKVVHETIAFVTRELTNKQFGFYSALDADSEGVEGKYYVWQKEELQHLLKDDFELFADYYCVNEVGYWEDENYVLMRDTEDSVIALQYHISIDELQRKMQACKTLLLSIREKRVKPGLDNKVLASWNGLMCKALAEAYLVFDNSEFKTLALANAVYLLNNYCRDNGQLLRVMNDHTSISGFLEDYAFVIDAFLSVYVITANETWLIKAKELADYTLRYFYVPSQSTYFFTDSSQEKLVVRKAEWSDNVIPASGSQMAINLYKLSIYFDDTNYRQISESLLKSTIKEIENYGPGYSNWALLLLHYLKPQTEVVIVGKSVNEKLLALYKQTPPNVIFALSDTASDLPLLKNRYVEGQTFIYVCRNNSCLLPTESAEEALKQIEEGTT
ncbi:MAG: thioredoxin domain-containing protein [Bacteroidetes bacterium]|nr:thioredoxin domain-containing protein [Bacteroidota bacterium]